MGFSLPDLGSYAAKGYLGGGRDGTVYDMGNGQVRVFLMPGFLRVRETEQQGLSPIDMDVCIQLLSSHLVYARGLAALSGMGECVIYPPLKGLQVV